MNLGNRTTLIVLAIVVFVIFVCGASIASTYNGMVRSANNVRMVWADVESAYQRRLDLVNQTLPSVVAGAQQELAVFKTLRDQAAALSASFKRDELGQPIVPQGADAQNIQQQIVAFDRAWINALAYMADNPEIQSTQLYSNFMIQVEGSENRINVARRDYNAAVNDYRNTTQTFPNNLAAGIFGFDPNQFAYFQAQPGAEQAPEVSFPTPVP